MPKEEKPSLSSKDLKKLVEILNKVKGIKGYTLFMPEDSPEEIERKIKDLKRQQESKEDLQ